ncbi:hypothetical protein J6S46_03140 [Candidatus Saccharibacteria bacterium]|nr:hypothetical protein [Candidatus Saccharibacteria bacterium]
MDETGRRKLENSFDAYQKKIESLERELSETKEQIKDLAKERDKNIAAFWTELDKYVQVGQFAKSLKTSKRLKEAVGKLVVKLGEADHFSRSRYYRYLNFDALDDALLSPRCSKVTQYIIISENQENLEETEKAFFENKTLVLIQHVPGDRDDEIRESIIKNRWAILGFFYRQNQRDIEKAIVNFVDFVEKAVKREYDGEFDYKEALYHIWVTGSILP